MAHDKTRGYEPRPLSLDDIEFEPELVGLVEALAKNAHDVWALQRLNDGWTWGVKRCDAEKTHPDLVDYDDLADSERTYDRIMVTNTIRAIIALGFQITRHSQPDPSQD